MMTDKLAGLRRYRLLNSQMEECDEGMFIAVSDLLPWLERALAQRQGMTEDGWIDANQQLPEPYQAVEAICLAHMEVARYGRAQPYWNAYSTQVYAWRPVRPQAAEEGGTQS